VCACVPVCQCVCVIVSSCCCIAARPRARWRGRPPATAPPCCAAPVCAVPLAGDPSPSVMLLLLLLLSSTAAAAVEDSGGCPAGSQLLPNTCFVVGGAAYLGGGPSNLSYAECCAACAARQDVPATERCTGIQWNHAGNEWGAANITRDCARPDTTCCFLFNTVPAVKRPVHPAQSMCSSATMPQPPAPPWPATPTAGAKNVIYMLVDDLRTQMTPYGTAGQHSYMHTPHFAAFADTAVMFEQAHCNSQMCVPTRNSFMYVLPAPRVFCGAIPAPSSLTPNELTAYFLATYLTRR
jgi:hypothetical protein